MNAKVLFRYLFLLLFPLAILLQGCIPSTVVVRQNQPTGNSSDPALNLELPGEKPSPVTSTTAWSGPMEVFYPAQDNGFYMKYTGFSLSYIEDHEQPSWVAYLLTRDMLNPVAKRADNFRADPRVPTGSATPKDYSRSGYDRGHLAPAADMAYSEQTMSESFFMTNMSPQVPAFNRGIWKSLEEQVREWARRDGQLYVITGGVLSQSLGTIGENKITIPAYYYKALFDFEEPEVKMIGFLLKNEGSNLPLTSFAITIDSLEAFTGLNFFPWLPDSPEEYLESKLELPLWFTNSTAPKGTSLPFDEDENQDDEEPSPQPTVVKININTAFSKDLQSVNGIGPTTAERIINGRPYKTLRDLLKVSGIGQATYDRISPFLTVD